MTLSIIAAIDENRAIGYKNKLLFHIDSDLKRFRQLTTGHTIIMGRNTYNSLPNGPLPDRRNIIVSTTLRHISNAEVYKSLHEALNACKDEDEVFVIGGEMIYCQAISIADRLYITHIENCAPCADAWFPPFDTWVLKELIPNQGFSFSMYERG